LVEPGGVRILVAEDDVVSSRLIQRSLEKHGYQFDLVKDGVAAWEALQSGQYSVLITDWMMPGLEGPELCSKVRASQLPFCYIIVLTAKTSAADKMAAIHAGADDFLSKPLSEPDLIARLMAASRLTRMHQELERANAELASQREDLARANDVLTRQREELSVALKRLEDASRIADISRNRFSQLFEGLPLPCFTVGTDGLVYEWNEESATRFGVPPHLAIGRTVQDLLGTRLVDEEALRSIEAALNGMAFVSEDWNDGEQYYLASGYPLHSYDGQVTGAILTLVDVTAQRLAEAKLEDQLRTINELYDKLQVANQRLESIASLDGLTGIPNHRTFHERLAGLVEIYRQSREPFCLALMDVDHFKRFNDDFGHLAGDEVLKSVAATLNGAVRGSDVVARYGGEEFAVLFRGAELETGVRLAERLREAIASLPPTYRQITISIGVAQFDDSIPDAEELIRRADVALYAAKRAGRNCVRTWNPALEAEAA
jgi:two-component system cell cycle response regulator